MVYLFLGQRSLNKIIGIVREEMDQIGQEFYLPAILPSEPWERERPLDGHGRQHVPPEGPQGRGPVPGHDARRDHDHDRARRIAQLQAVAADLVPDSDQVPRRAAAQVGPAARAPVHHEGQLLLRHRQGRPGQELRSARRGLSRHLHALRAQVRRRRGRFRLDGRLAVAGVHGLHRRRRGPDRKLPGLRLRGESGEGDFAA